MRKLLVFMLLIIVLLPITVASGQDDDNRTVFRWDEYGLSFVYPTDWGERLDAEGFLVISTDDEVLDSFVDPDEIALVIAVIPDPNAVFLMMPPDINTELDADATAEPTEAPTEAPTETPEPSNTPDLPPADDATALELFIIQNDFFGADVAPGGIEIVDNRFGTLGIALGPDDDFLHQQIAVLADDELTFVLRLYDPNDEVSTEDFRAVLDSAVLSGATVPLATPEPDEGFAANAIPIANGETLTGTLDEDTQSVFYTFEAEGGQFVTIEMIAEDDIELDTLLYLYADDEEIFDNDDGISGTFNSRIANFRLPDSTRFVIEATKFDGAGDYSISLTIIEDPSVDLVLGDAIESGELFYGDRITDTLVQSTDSRYYTFTATAGDEILVVMEAADPQQLDTRLTIYDEDGRQIAFNDDAEFGNFNSRIQTVIIETGTYYIVAESFFGNGNYDLLLELR